MADGPRPLIPFLMVITLWFIIYGRSLMNSFSLVEKMSFDFLVVVPILLLLFIYFSSQSVIVPLILVLVMYIVFKTLLGPLILIFIIYFLSVYLPMIGTYRRRGGGRGGYFERDGGYENVGWGSVWFFVMFIVLYGLFYEGEGHDWYIALVITVIFILYNLVG